MSKTPIWVTRSSMPDFEEYTAEIASLWDSHMLMNMGPKHKKLVSDLKEYLGVPKRYYRETNQGYELTIKRRMDALRGSNPPSGL